VMGHCCLRLGIYGTLFKIVRTASEKIQTERTASRVDSLTRYIA